MAFIKKTWKDRLVEFAGRRQIVRASGDPNGTMVVDVTRAEGNVSQAGDAFSAANMNDMEQRIADGFEEVINDLTALNDSGAIKGLDAREDGVYITYVPTNGADPVTKKLGSNNCKIKIIYGTSASWESSHTRVFISAQLYKDDTLINTINILDAHVMGNPISFNNIEYAFPD